jgi:hypothetical protein
LCYNVIESIFPGKCVRFSGKALADQKIDGSPDYYMRKGKNILLVESKDFLIAAEKKMSFDYNVYESEFARILDYEEMPDGRLKPKAVLQLANNVRMILKKSFTADTDYHYKDVSIYPVLLTHDHQYDTPGFNELIDSWFQDELLELEQEGLFIGRVMPLSVVNIDSLIYYQIGLVEASSLFEILRLYHENKKLKKEKKKNFKSEEEHETYLEDYRDMLMSKCIPFSMFIETHFQKKGKYKPPPLLGLVGPALFSEEYKQKKGL